MIDTVEYLICSKCKEEVEKGIHVNFNCRAENIKTVKEKIQDLMEEFIFCSPRCAQEALSEKIHETVKGRES